MLQSQGGGRGGEYLGVAFEAAHVRFMDCDVSVGAGLVEHEALIIGELDVGGEPAVDLGGARLQVFVTSGGQTAVALLDHRAKPGFHPGLPELLLGRERLIRVTAGLRAAPSVSLSSSGDPTSLGVVVQDQLNMRTSELAKRSMHLGDH